MQTQVTISFSIIFKISTCRSGRFSGMIGIFNILKERYFIMVFTCLSFNYLVFPLYSCKHLKSAKFQICLWETPQSTNKHTARGYGSDRSMAPSTLLSLCKNCHTHDQGHCAGWVRSCAQMHSLGTRTVRMFVVMCAALGKVPAHSSHKVCGVNLGK